MALLQAHKRAHGAIYKKLGLLVKATLTVEQTASICNEVSGLLGCAIRRHLKSCGINLASKAAVKAHFKKSWHEVETGTITIADPKRPGKLLTAGWLRVKDFHAVVQRTLNRLVQSDEIVYPANMPAYEIWLEVVMDKGGHSHKLCLKFLNVKSPDSVRMLVLTFILIFVLVLILANLYSYLTP